MITSPSSSTSSRLTVTGSELPPSVQLPGVTSSAFRLTVTDFHTVEAFPPLATCRSDARLPAGSTLFGTQLHGAPGVGVGGVGVAGVGVGGVGGVGVAGVGVAPGSQVLFCPCPEQIFEQH